MYLIYNYEKFHYLLISDTYIIVIQPKLIFIWRRYQILLLIHKFNFLKTKLVCIIFLVMYMILNYDKFHYILELNTYTKYHSH